MKGYLAEKEQEYVLLIEKKIRREIRTSDCLVAIITDIGLKSASVHEEIGFAIGKDIPVLLMMDESLKEREGVLIHGKEPEYFNETNFESHSQKIIKYIQNNIQKRKSDMDNSMKEFLLKRNLMDDEADNFCKNSQTRLLQSTIEKPLLPNGTPFILFSAYPRNFVDIDIHDKYDGFFEKNRHINIQDHKIRFIEGRKEIEINSIVYRYRAPDRSIRKYLEFQKNGFVEQGFSSELIYKAGTPVHGPVLNGCFATGAFWAFVKFCKLYYERIKNVGEFDIIFSVRNCRDLRLLAYRENKKEGDLPSRNFDIPETKLSNIRRLVPSLEPDQMTDEIIASKVHKISDSMAHAYGLQNSTCYDLNNIFDWNRMDDYSLSM